MLKGETQMASPVEKQVKKCIAGLKKGTLTEKDLNKITEISDISDTGRNMQDILYLHASLNSPTSDILAMRIVENGEVSDGPQDPDDWPYQTVIDAVRDGWHIIKFPELALMMDESRTYSLGFEFILERPGGLVGSSEFTSTWSTY